jgi:YfiH family protein
MSAALEHPLLRACGVRHGFGTKGSGEPPGLTRPRQVHGRGVARALASGELSERDADAVVSREPGLTIGIVTADCVPILAASRSGDAVAAIHAGWRGLASGVIEAGIEALARESGGADPLVAVVGPHIGPAAYEVDQPVLSALEARFGSELAAALTPSRPGHALLDLGALARAALLRSGLSRDAVAALANTCTYRNVELFHSYRRDGAAAGRLVHFIAANRGLAA